VCHSVSLRPPVLAALAQVASLFGLFVGGLFLGLLRQRTGNLAGCVVFHWLVVTAMWGTLFLMSREPSARLDTAQGCSILMQSAQG